MTDENSTTTHRSMGRPPQHMKEIKVQFPAETLEQIDSLVGNKFRSKFIRAAVDGALATAKQVRPAGPDDDKLGR